MGWWRFSAWLGFGLVLAACKEDGTSSKQGLRSVHVAPANIAYPNAEKFVASDVKTLLATIQGSDELKVSSSGSGTVPEPELRPGVPRPSDLEILGYRKSSFLADSRWATIRFLGSQPAGAGLEGDAQDKAQSAALGSPNDTVPVTTAAWTVTRIMADYFVPLLESLPGGKDILSQFKIQGAYFAPGYVPEGTSLERDNAFMVGLQSLYLWPSSCFERPQGDECPAPFMSTAHDPTVVGHEVSHAVFNHLRKGRSLDGFQWIAVNEGYADYFSAAYFSEPVLGRIWKVSSSKHPYLRALNQDASTEDPKLAEEAHQFGIVWGSTLWRIRERLVKETAAKPFAVDRIFLHAITYLGETSKIRLGDAASSVLKSAEALDATPYKRIMREEFENARIALAENRFSSDAVSASGMAAADAGPVSEKKSGAPRPASGGCGVVAGEAGAGRLVLALIPLLGALVPGLLSLRRRKR